MKTAVLVLTWNAADVAVACLHTLVRQQYTPDYTLVVDNGSADGTAEQVQHHFPDIHIVRNRRNLGFSRGMNVGIRTLQAMPEPPDIVVLLNQDTLLDPRWLGELVAPFKNDPHIGAAGCKIRYQDGTIQHAGAYLEWPRAVAHHIGWHEPDNGQYDEMKSCDLVTGAALALRMEALNTIGLFDPGYTPAYYEDTDLCWRLHQHQYTIVYVPQAVITHRESHSLRNAVTRSSYYNRGRLRFVLKSYAYTYITGTFAEHELEFMRKHGHAAEERALRWAYIETLLRLPDILQARRAFHPALSTEDMQELTRMLFAFKDGVTQSMYRRAYARLDAFTTL